jgi:hypothetical protein
MKARRPVPSTASGRHATGVAVAVAAALCAGPALAQESTGRERYSIKQSTPSTGTHIPRDEVIGSLPFNKSYAELTPEQQAGLKAMYERMGEGDEPPYPLKGTRALYQAISAVHQRLGRAGELYMLADINSEGQATAVSVMRSPDPQMTQAAAAALLLEKYKPARCAGVPCRMQFPLLITFERRPG